MKRLSRRLLLVGVGVLTIALAGCTPTAPQAAGPTAEPTVAAGPAVGWTPALSELVSASCDGAPLGTPASDTVPELPAAAVAAITFFAESDQCDDIASVEARAASGENLAEFVSPLQYIDAQCPAETTLSFWAHYDDDLIFGNPTIQDSLALGGCVRTFFFTYSDAGEGESTYASDREAGIRASYSQMAGTSSEWVDRTVVLASGAAVTMTSPVDDPNISLFFLRLPDGGLSGTTFEYTGEQTLQKLRTGDLPSLRTLDTGRSVGLETLKETVAEYMRAYAPDRVLTHLPADVEGSDGDHPDHQSVGAFVRAAIADYGLSSDAVSYAIGYPSAGSPINLSDEVVQSKAAIFAIYASHDPVVGCSTAAACLQRSQFGDWLARQYLVPAASLPVP